jgi:hypothetical protein
MLRDDLAKCAVTATKERTGFVPCRRYTARAKGQSMADPSKSARTLFVECDVVWHRIDGDAPCWAILISPSRKGAMTAHLPAALAPVARLLAPLPCPYQCDVGTSQARASPASLAALPDRRARGRPGSPSDRGRHGPSADRLARCRSSRASSRPSVSGRTIRRCARLRNSCARRVYLVSWQAPETRTSRTVFAV